MVKFLILNALGRETSKYSHEFNTYGMREELLFPIEMNDSFPGQPQPDTNLAIYLIKLKEFQKSTVEIKKNENKARFYKYFFINI